MSSGTTPASRCPRRRRQPRPSSAPRPRTSGSRSPPPGSTRCGRNSIRCSTTRDCAGSSRRSRCRCCRCSPPSRRAGSVSTAECSGGSGAIWKSVLRDLTARIHELAGAPFDIQSPKQLGEILFDTAEPAPDREDPETQAGLDARLGPRRAGPHHELPRLVLEYRELAKLKSTYVDPLPELVSEPPGASTPGSTRRWPRPGAFPVRTPTSRTSPSAPRWGSRCGRRSSPLRESG